MKTVNELRDNLSTVWEDLRAGTIATKDAEALANLAGKMVNSAKMQIEYYALRKEAPYIEFLHSTDTEEAK